MPLDLDKEGSTFQRARAFHRSSSFGHFRQAVPSATQDQEGAADSEPLRLSKVSLLQSMAGRSSVREFGQAFLEIADIYDVIWSAYGRLTTSPEWERRTVPSAGAIYPLRFCAYFNAVNDFEAGFYEVGKEVKPLEAKLSGEISQLFLTRHIHYSTSGAIIFIMGDLEKICSKYGERGYRYLLLEAGHSAQNICLAATALDIPHITVGGFDDSSVNEILSAHEEEKCIYSVVLGKRA